MGIKLLSINVLTRIPTPKSTSSLVIKTRRGEKKNLRWRYRKSEEHHIGLVLPELVPILLLVEISSRILGETYVGRHVVDARLMVSLDSNLQWQSQGETRTMRSRSHNNF